MFPPEGREIPQSEIPIRPPRRTTRPISASTAGLSTERLITEFEVTTSTDAAGSGTCSITPLRKIAFRTPASEAVRRAGASISSGNCLAHRDRSLNSIARSSVRSRTSLAQQRSSQIDPQPSQKRTLGVSFLPKTVTAALLLISTLMNISMRVDMSSPAEPDPGLEPDSPRLKLGAPCEEDQARLSAGLRERFFTWTLPS
jgi:hypothetical protein